MSQLVTGDAVVLDLRTAGVPSRALAAVLDLVVQVILFFLLLTLSAAVAAGSSGAAAAAWTITIMLLVWLGYPVAMETLVSGRTLGKLALGLRVVRDDGSPIAFRHAITRGLIGLFVEKPGLSMGSAAMITALLNERGKRLGDLAAGTIVVQERVAGRPAEMAIMPPPLASWAATLDLTSLTDDLAGSARAYLGRYASLTPSAQAELGGRIAAAVQAVVRPAPPPGVPAWAYLSAVLAERRRRSVPPPAYQPQGYRPPVGYGPPQGYGPPVGMQKPPAPAEPDAPGAFAPPA